MVVLSRGTREMRLVEYSTDVSRVENVRLSAGSGFFRGQDARAPLFRGCLFLAADIQNGA